MSEKNSNFVQKNPFQFGEGLYARMHSQEKYSTVQQKQIDNPYLQQNPFQKNRLPDNESKFLRYRCKILCRENQLKTQTISTHPLSSYQLKQKARQLDHHENWKRQAYRQEQINLKYYGVQGLRFNHYPRSSQIPEQPLSFISSQESIFEGKKKQRLSSMQFEQIVWKPRNGQNVFEGIFKEEANKKSIRKGVNLNPQTGVRSEDDENESLLNRANTSRMGYESDVEESEKIKLKRNTETIAAQSNILSSGNVDREGRPRAKSNIFLQQNFGKPSPSIQINPNIKTQFQSYPPETIKINGRNFHYIETK